jgi:cell division protein FtsI (penicillin-binding protein 3)
VIIQKKIIFIFCLLSALFALVLGRAFYLQVYKSKSLIDYARTQFSRTVSLYPYRGQIIDRNNSPLAINVQMFDLFIMPQYLKNKNEIKQLCQTVPVLNCAQVYAAIKNRTKFTWIARDLKLSEKQVKKIKTFGAVNVEEKFARFYPNNELMGQILGFVNVDNKGIAGIEYAYDQSLRGSPKVVKYLRDAKGRAIKYEQIQFHGKGSDVVLSVDRDLQAMVEHILVKGVQTYNAKGAGAAILDPATGEILAMANVPLYNPNQYQKFPPQNRKLGFISDPFEPGSVFKLFTIAAALEAGVATPDKKYFCEKGAMKIGKYVIGEANNHKFEWLSVADIFKHSSNVGTTKVAMDLGFKKLDQFLNKIKIGKQTGIEIRGESKGIYRSTDKISLIHLSNLSFGQGVATTALQILSAYGAIANGGVWLKPSILKQEEAVRGERILSTKTVNQLTAMLESVVSEGTGNNAKLDHYTMAGKTSTAQKVGSDGKYTGIIAGFIGFPINAEKRYVVYVYVDEPKTKIYGNDVAAPLFREIMEQVLYKSKFKAPALKEDLALKQDKIFDEVNTSASAIQREIGGMTPNFIGLDKVSAQELAQRNKIKLQFNGSGLVIEQKPASTEEMPAAMLVKLKFAQPE